MGCVDGCPLGSIINPIPRPFPPLLLLLLLLLLALFGLPFILLDGAVPPFILVVTTFPPLLRGLFSSAIILNAGLPYNPDELPTPPLPLPLTALVGNPPPKSFESPEVGKNPPAESIKSPLDCDDVVPVASTSTGNPVNTNDGSWSAVES